MRYRRAVVIASVIVLGVLALVVWGPWHIELPWPVATAHYVCNDNKAIDAAFYGNGELSPLAKPGEPPTPSGRVELAFSDGSSRSLRQTLSADGVRYANEDESFIFWSKGEGALVLERGEERTYKDCVRVAPLPEGSDLEVVHHGTFFTLRVPKGYVVHTDYAHEALGPGKTIYGTSFSIPSTVYAGTNLSSDTYVSVESVPGTDYCSADLFLADVPGRGMATDGTLEVASTTGAAAGNRYEETVYALPGTSPCVAVRYFIHYGAIENYPEGAVNEFDKDALLSAFDAIRSTLVVAP